MIQAFAFYLFSGVMILSALLTITARNPVHSVLWLILAFFNAAGLMLLLGAEFIAMLLVIVYVGAVAVLLLFVVMMLDIDFAELKGELARYLPLGLLIGLVMMAQLGGSVEAGHHAEYGRAFIAPAPGHKSDGIFAGLFVFGFAFWVQDVPRTGNVPGLLLAVTEPALAGVVTR